MKKPLFTGCGTALVTPFKNGEVDFEALDRLVEDQIANGVSALIAVGTTGVKADLVSDEDYAVLTNSMATLNALAGRDTAAAKIKFKIPGAV